MRFVHELILVLAVRISTAVTETETNCTLGPWSSWHTCRGFCSEIGVSRRVRDVEALQPDAVLDDCQPQSISADCLVYSCTDDGLPVYSKCEMSGWMPWSQCSTDCGRGYQYRQRTVFFRPHGVECSRTVDKRPCRGYRCNGDCAMSEWSSWSWCSCFSPLRHRHRTVQVQPGENGKQCGPLTQTEICIKICAEQEEGPDMTNFYGYDQVYHGPYTSNHGLSGSVFNLRHSGLVDVPGAKIGPELEKARYSISQRWPFCFLPMSQGACAEGWRWAQLRYYYDSVAQMCRPFLYSGCPGNPNRFLTHSMCQAVCGLNLRIQPAERSRYTKFAGELRFWKYH